MRAPALADCLQAIPISNVASDSLEDKLLSGLHLPNKGLPYPIIVNYAQIFLKAPELHGEIYFR